MGSRQTPPRSDAPVPEALSPKAGEAIADALARAAGPHYGYCRPQGVFGGVYRVQVQGAVAHLYVGSPEYTLRRHNPLLRALGMEDYPHPTGAEKEPVRQLSRWAGGPKATADDWSAFASDWRYLARTVEHQLYFDVRFGRVSQATADRLLRGVESAVRTHIGEDAVHGLWRDRVPAPAQVRRGPLMSVTKGLSTVARRLVAAGGENRTSPGAQGRPPAARHVPAEPVTGRRAIG